MLIYKWTSISQNFNPNVAWNQTF